MKTRTVGVAVLAVLALALVGSVVGVVAATGDEPESTGRPVVGAQQVVDAVGAKWPLPNPRDTTSGCKAREGDTARGCESRVTTDAVTVTEYVDAALAKQAAGVLDKAGDARPAGRYVLSWAGDQSLTSDEARADMVRIAASL